MKTKPSNKALTPKECAKVLAVAESEMKGLIFVALTTGQHIRDIIALKRGDVDLTRGIICFRTGSRTGALEIPLDLRLRNWLEQQPHSTIPIDLDTSLFPQLAARGPVRAAEYIRKLGEKVGLVVSAVSFRHTYFHELIAKGTPRVVVQKLMGHGGRK